MHTVATCYIQCIFYKGAECSSTDCAKYKKLVCGSAVLLVDNISIFHVCMVWIEKSVTRVTDRHHKACRVMPNSDPE